MNKLEIAERTDGRDFLKITQDTILKKLPIQSRQITDSKSLHPCKAGTSFTLAAWGEEDNHFKITLYQSEIKGLNTWFVWKPHCEMSVANPEVAAISFATKTSDRGPSVKVPGISQAIFLNDPIIPKGNIHWYELIGGGGELRIPEDAEVTGGIIRIAKAAQEARDRIGKPFVITSGYRPPHINASVGGASNSRHLWGDAIDFWVEGFTGRQLYQALDPWWSGGLGQYWHYPYLCHLDARNYEARWG